MNWGIGGIIRPPIKIEKQLEMIMPLTNILGQSGCTILVENGQIMAKSSHLEKRVVIYPAMWVEPHKDNMIFISDAYVKYAKPYAVQKIIDSIY